MSRTIARWLLVAILPLAIAATQYDAPRRIDQLMRKSGLWAQLGQMQDQVRNGSQDWLIRIVAWRECTLYVIDKKSQGVRGISEKARMMPFRDC